jgi:hypothetical protein
MESMARGDGLQLHASASAPSEFAGWLPEDFSLQLMVRREHGNWYATAREFTVTGMGDSPRSAVREAAELVVDYLLAYFRDGQPYEAARRPASFGLATKVESRVGTLLSSVLRGAADQMPIPRRERVSLPALIEDCPQPVG